MVDYLLAQLNILEVFGAFFAVIQVILSRKNKVNNYLFGIASILISLWLYYHNGLYADILLNLYYLVMSVYGWFNWKFGRHYQATPISWANRRDYIIAGGISLCSFLVIYYWLNYHTDSTVPVWDALVAGFAWAGMWLMAKRKMENWIFLNISNVIATPLLIYKELYIYAGLTVFLFIMGVSGYLKWKNISKHDQSHEHSLA